MNKVFIFFFVLTSLGFYYFFNEKTKNCVGTPDGVNYPKVFRAKRDETIKLQFDMLRTPAVGCIAKDASEYYKKVSCGYRLVNSQDWILLKPKAIIDNEMKYSVVCEVPVLGESSLEAPTLEYYLEYSAWGGPLERQVKSIILE